MSRDSSTYIEDILESINKIQSYCRDVSKEEFLNNSQLQDALIRRFEIIGESVKYLPLDFRNSHPGIEWKKIAGLRDVLIHEYFGVNLNRIWKVIKEDIPELHKKITEIRKEIS